MGSVDGLHSILEQDIKGLMLNTVLLSGKRCTTA
jgi:hypothetical protein